MPIVVNCDSPIKFLRDFAESLTHSPGGHGKSRHTLTSETRNAAKQTVNGLLCVSQYLLQKCGFTYVLLGHFQSDALEGEFGIYRQLNGGCYYISVEQIINTAKLRQMKLYSLFEDISNVNACSARNACCDSHLSSDEILLLDEMLLTENTLFDFSDEEKSTLFYICGFITMKHGLECESQNIQNLPPSAEFTLLVSRGKLKIPPAWLFNLSLYCYKWFILTAPTCTKHTVKLFTYLAESIFIDHNKIVFILQTLTNTFFKGFVKLRTEQTIHSKPSYSERKLRKLSSS